MMKPVLCFVLCAIAGVSPLTVIGQRAAMNCSQTTVVTAAEASIAEKNAIAMLLEEVAKRTGLHWEQSIEYPRRANGTQRCLIVAATVQKMPTLLPPTLARIVRKTPQAAEAFSLHTLLYLSRPVVLIEGHDARGVLFGIGALLRKMEMEPGKVDVPADLHRIEQPASLIRSHQLGYRFKNNTYDAWTLGQFEQQIRDLAVFGANTIQLIVPVSDDEKSSPLFPAPALETLIGVSGILDRYGLNCDLYYPEMEPDYARAADIERELSRFEELFRQVPRVDAVYIPGGDPGHTPPDLLFPLIEKEAAILRRYHPEAKVYVSAQGMDAGHFEDFYRQMQRQPKWLNGVFFGPQSRDSFEMQRARIPAKYPMVFYPDIGHTMHAQFPVPDWDPVFALTEGREPVNPRPLDEGLIYRHFAPMHIGFVTYSEGVNDEVNKMLWTAWGCSATTAPQGILEEYARYFIGPRFVKTFPRAIFDLEENWRGPLRSNLQIDKTLAEFEAIESDPKGPKENWRLELALYRAYYDAYLQKRLIAEQAQEIKALDALSKAAQVGPERAMQDAEVQLAMSEHVPGEELREHVFDLAGQLFRHIGMQLSVKLYGASNWERGANLDRIDIPLNNRVWYGHEFARIRGLDEVTQLVELARLSNWEHLIAGALYDDLGEPSREPHLVRGRGFSADPEMYASAIDGVADRTPEDNWRWSELSYAEALYETPVELKYDKLEITKQYKLRVIYAGEDYALPIRLLANAGAEQNACLLHTPEARGMCGKITCVAAEGCYELQAPTQRKSNPQMMEYVIPAEATRQGTLDLQWRQPYGQGGSGRGNQVAEVWLIPIQ